MVALHDRYGIGKDRLDRVINAANGALERFAVNKRGVGMERNYGERFESALPVEFEICERMATGNELFYALRRV